MKNVVTAKQRHVVVNAAGRQLLKTFLRPNLLVLSNVIRWSRPLLLLRSQSSTVQAVLRIVFLLWISEFGSFVFEMPSYPV